MNHFKVSAHSNALHNKQTTDNGFIFLKHDHDLFFILGLKRFNSPNYAIIMNLSDLFGILIHLCQKYIDEIKTLHFLINVLPLSQGYKFGFNI